MCEPYKHWVIEDDFVDDARPPWETVGATLTKDVVSHELMKVRLLNVTHSAMCYPAILAGLTHVHEACLHSKIRSYLELVMLEEIAPTLRTNPEMREKSLCDRIPAYAQSVLERFENVAVKDQLERIAMDGSEKFRVQGSSVVREGLALGLPMDAFALYVASWTHFVKREVESGAEVKDMGAQGVTAPFRPGGSGLPAFLDMVDIFGDLAYEQTWRANVTRMYDTIAEHGMEFALDVVLGTVSAFPDSIRSDLRLDNPTRVNSMSEQNGDEAVVSVVNPARLNALDPIMYTSEMLSAAESANVQSR
jgi:mannitol 2-dehydrogenase